MFIWIETGKFEERCLSQYYSIDYTISIAFPSGEENPLWSFIVARYLILWQRSTSWETPSRGDLNGHILETSYYWWRRAKVRCVVLMQNSTSNPSDKAYSPLIWMLSKCLNEVLMEFETESVVKYSTTTLGYSCWRTGSCVVWSSMLACDYVKSLELLVFLTYHAATFNPQSFRFYFSQRASDVTALVQNIRV